MHISDWPVQHRDGGAPRSDGLMAVGDPRMNLHVGTSGYSYKEWKGSFYPVDFSAKRMLHYYGERFDAVEINNSFYRMPTVSALEGWTADVPSHFRFVLEAPQL